MFRRIALASIGLLAVASARADTLWIRSASAGGGAVSVLEIRDVKVTGVEGGKLLFNSAGRDTSRDLAQISKLQVDDEPALSAAENALGSNQFDAATDGYRKALDGASKDWVKTWAAQRLIFAAQRANRFDVAVQGYIALVITDPAIAAASKPALPNGQSSFLATAINQVNTALGDAKLAPPQRQALTTFLLDLQRAKGDEKAAAATVEQLLKNNPDPAAGAAIAKLKLDSAAAALKGNDFAKAKAEITSNRAAFTDPKDQAQALLILAEAQAGTANQSNDANAWKDAALAYMRIVAHFPDSPTAPPALLKTAQIEQKLNDLDAARSLYQQLAKQYPSDPSAAAAQAALQQLSANNTK
jgi:TolA-binding protein